MRQAGVPERAPKRVTDDRDCRPQVIEEVSDRLASSQSKVLDASFEFAQNAAT